MPTLEDAILLALQAHWGQVDKGGEPYILHPLRVMLSLTSKSEQMAGILHDVVEDTPETLASLESMGYLEEVLQALDCLTRRSDEPYEHFIARAKANPIARRVKLADLEDNMLIQRLRALTDHDIDRLKRYREAWSQLKEAH